MRSRETVRRAGVRAARRAAAIAAARSRSRLLVQNEDAELAVIRATRATAERDRGGQAAREGCAAKGRFDGHGVHTRCGSDAHTDAPAGTERELADLRVVRPPCDGGPVDEDANIDRDVVALRSGVGDAAVGLDVEDRVRGGDVPDPPDGGRALRRPHAQEREQHVRVLRHRARPARVGVSPGARAPAGKCPTK